MSHAVSMYSPLLRHLHVLQQIEANEGEMTPELDEALTITEQNVTERAGTLLELRDSVQGLILSGETKIKQAQEFIVHQKRILAHLDNNLKAGVQLVGPITIDTRKVFLKPSTGVVIDDENLLSDEYVTRKVVAQPDKVKIGKALKDGKQVPGASLETRANLQVK